MRRSRAYLCAVLVLCQWLKTLSISVSVHAHMCMHAQVATRGIEVSDDSTGVTKAATCSHLQAGVNMIGQRHEDETRSISIWNLLC